MNPNGHPRVQKSRRDPRWVLATLCILGAFALQATLTWRGDEQDMPAWVVGLVSAVVSYYYGARNGKNPHPSELPPTDEETVTTTKPGETTTTTTRTAHEIGGGEAA